MSFYTTFQIVESPLSEDLRPLLRISKQDLPPDPVQRRMLVILGFVLLLISVFALSWIPLGGEDSVGDNVTAVGELPLTGNPIVPPVATLSPVFSAEVMHWSDQINEWSASFQLDPDIVATIMQIESCGDPQAVSSAGAQGLFQVMPFHFEAGEDAFDPQTNASRGLAYYRQQLGETRGDIFLSFAGYNGGSAASSSGWDLWSSETQRYYVWSKGIYQDAKAGLSTSPTLQRWMEAGGASLCRQAADRLGLIVPVEGK